MILAALSLALCLIAYAAFLRGRLFDRAVARGWFASGSRDARFAFWCVKALLLFGGTGAIALLMLPGLPALTTLPPEFAAARRDAVALIGGDGFPVALILAAMVAGGAVGELVGWVRRRTRPFMLGDIGVLMPRTRAEMRWGAAMAVVAGVSEELFFRLTVPLAIAMLTGSAWLGFGVGLTLFAMAHRYQGWLGVAATAFVGAVMIALYLASGDLWLAMLIHGAIDLNGLVLRPLLRSFLPARAPRRIGA